MVVLISPFLKRNVPNTEKGSRKGDEKNFSSGFVVWIIHFFLPRHWTQPQFTSLITNVQKGSRKKKKYFLNGPPPLELSGQLNLS